jgi:hypothetical protein
VDNAWEQEKLEARKMLENAAESHTSGARFVSRVYLLPLFFVLITTPIAAIIAVIMPPIAVMSVVNLAFSAVILATTTSGGSAVAVEYTCVGTPASNDVGLGWGVGERLPDCIGLGVPTKAKIAKERLASLKISALATIMHNIKTSKATQRTPVENL